MYQKNQILEVDITDMTNDGEGVGKVEGCTFFVKDALIGDRALIRVTKVKKTYAFGRLEKLIKPSPGRIDAPCPEARRCGGCQIQALSYEEQLRFKKNKVINNLVRIGGFSREEIEKITEEIIGMTDPKTGCYRYRNKAQYPVGTDREKNPVAGFYAGRTHAIIPVGDCLIGIPENEAILEAVLDWMRMYGIPAYDEEKQGGTIRHILIRKGFATGEIMVCLVINAKKLPHEEELVRMLCALSFPSENSIRHISYSTNTDNTNVIMGDNYRTIYGEDVITDRLGGLTFRISPLSFYQVNPVQTEKLYEKALSCAGLTGKETVWDLYCGIGTISLFLARKAGHVCGVEVVPQAIEDARTNAKENGLENTTFFVGKAEEVIDRLYREGNAKGNDSSMLHPDVIVVDPPRKGLDPLCIETMLKMSPKRIVYVSCDSATLARDLNILCDGGYELRSVTSVDMFPHTVHVETAVLLQRSDA